VRLVVDVQPIAASHLDLTDERCDKLPSDTPALVVGMHDGVEKKGVIPPSQQACTNPIIALPSNALIQLTLCRSSRLDHG
jgi:hypothetical protein